MNPIQIIIADDHKVVAQGLKALLESEPGFQVSNIASSGAALLEIMATSKPDLVILDVNMAGMDGIATLRKLREIYPDLAVLMLSTHSEIGIVSASFENGARGYMLKSSAPDELFDAIRKAASGQVVIDSLLASHLIHHVANRSDEAVQKSFPKVTAREKEVIRLIAQELTIKEIADKMGVSTHTIVAHKKNLFAKLKVKNSVGLVKAAFEAGIIPPQES